MFCKIIFSQHNFTLPIEILFTRIFLIKSAADMYPGSSMRAFCTASHFSLSFLTSLCIKYGAGTQYWDECIYSSCKQWQGLRRNQDMQARNSPDFMEIFPHKEEHPYHKYYNTRWTLHRVCLWSLLPPLTSCMLLLLSCISRVRLCATP